ncbi:MAG: hypothetical protein WBC60_06830 [Cognaticolwellia sp.]|jgi:hypothetical protein
MFKAVSKMLVIAAMLVAFVGQVLAFNTSMSCETSIDSISFDFNERVKHYDLNSIDTDNSEDCCGIECCDLSCTCIANACSSFVYFNTEVESTKIVALSEAFYKQHSAQPKFISALLYRPPIFTS